MTPLFILQMCAFLWIGFVCAISFMEAWLKFRAPGVTTALGLGIGKLVFGALNKVEWFFALVIFVFLLLENRSMSLVINLIYGIIIVILVAQTFWLLPALNAKADVHIKGQTPPPSSLHWYFVVAEVIKVVLLFIVGVSVLSSMSIS